MKLHTRFEMVRETPPPTQEIKPDRGDDVPPGARNLALAHTCNGGSTAASSPTSPPPRASSE